MPRLTEEELDSIHFLFGLAKNHNCPFYGACLSWTVETRSFNFHCLACPWRNVYAYPDVGELEGIMYLVAYTFLGYQNGAHGMRTGRQKWTHNQRESSPEPLYRLHMAGRYVPRYDPPLHEQEPLA